MPYVATTRIAGRLGPLRAAPGRSGRRRAARRPSRPGAATSSRVVEQPVQLGRHQRGVRRSRRRPSRRATGSWPATSERTTTCSPATYVAGSRSAQRPSPPSRRAVAATLASTARRGSSTRFGAPGRPRGLHHQRRRVRRRRARPAAEATTSCGSPATRSGSMRALRQSPGPAVSMLERRPGPPTHRPRTGPRTGRYPSNRDSSTPSPRREVGQLPLQLVQPGRGEPDLELGRARRRRSATSPRRPTGPAAAAARRRPRSGPPASPAAPARRRRCRRARAPGAPRPVSPAGSRTTCSSARAGTAARRPCCRRTRSASRRSR